MKVIKCAIVAYCVVVVVVFVAIFLAASSYRDEAHYEDIETTVIKDSRGEE